MNAFTRRSFARSTSIAAPALAVCFGLACEAPKPEETSKPVATEAQLAAATVEAKPAPAVEEPKKPSRPKTIPMELDATRRAALEKAYPEAKGFLFASDLEEKLKKDPANKSKDPALKSFDKMAKGKWVLFVGPMVNLKDSTFDVAVSYTPLAPNDPMGISRQFFTVTLKNVEGYDAEAMKAGTMVAVLAKYTGAGSAGPGHELVAAEHWQ